MLLPNAKLKKTLIRRRSDGTTQGPMARLCIYRKAKEPALESSTPDLQRDLRFLRALDLNKKYRTKRSGRPAGNGLSD